MNWLLAFIPVALVLDWMQASEPWIFFAAALAIVPVAALIVRSTEQVATYTGPTIGGLLNASFGNAPELIVALVALRAGLLDMVRASLIGGILANLLLALGIAFFAGGMRYHTQNYNAAAARLYGSMMLIASFSLIVPSAFSRFLAPEETVRAEALLNFGLAAVLLLAYALYLVFQLKTHPDEFVGAPGALSEEPAEAHGERWSLPRAIGSLIVASVVAAFMSEILVGAAQGTGEALGMSEIFIGVVFLAIVGGAAGPPAAVVMALRNKMDLSLGIALGAAIQIALFVAPVLVIASVFIAPQPLELSFTRAEVGALFMGALIGALVAGDGRSNWYKGVQLVAVYLIIALMFYFIPGAA
jgi:Ca2+:H+ antiporter